MRSLRNGIYVVRSATITTSPDEIETKGQRIRSLSVEEGCFGSILVPATFGVCGVFKVAANDLRIVQNLFCYFWMLLSPKFRALLIAANG